MNFSPDLETTRRRWWGVVAVLVLHVAVAWALMRGLASPVVQLTKPTVQVALVAEEPAPPPPPPPPPVVVQPKQVPPQKIVSAAPPPAAPTVVQAAATDAPSPVAITPTPSAPPAPPEVVVAAPPAPPAPPAAPARPVAQAMGLVCPKQVQPAMPRRASQEGINGRVEARATVRGGRVVAVEILSAKPRGLFDAAVKQAMLQYQCDSGAPGDVLADQVFEFKFDE
jgi:periplasmic protein TonB